MITLGPWLPILLAGALVAQATPPADPTQAEVPLPASEAWQATLVYESDVGIWTVRVVDVFSQYGSPEVIGLDDKGRCTVLVSYSGKWTPKQTVADGAWLGALAWADVDPSVAGRELYTGGKNGNLFRIRPHREGGFDCDVVARFPGLELHTFACADLLPSRPGIELLAFTHSGEVFDVRPGNTPGAPFVAPQIGQLPGRVRDAVVLPAPPGRTPRLATVSRAGELALLTMNGTGIDSTVVLREPMGFGRIALRPTVGAVVLYAARDDGLLLRLAEQPDGSWQRRAIYAGPQGLRGVAAGRFDADPERETVAVFGYSAKVQLLTAADGDGPWRVETVFTDRDKGHWLAVGELDGRNGTDEIIGSGYGGRIFQLSRPPGYGLETIATDPDKTAAAGRVRHARRVGTQ